MPDSVFASYPLPYRYRLLEGLRLRKIRHSLPLALLSAIPVLIQLVFLLRNQQVRTLVISDMILLLVLVTASTIFRKETDPGACKFLVFPIYAA